MGASGRKHAAMRFAAYDVLRRALRAPGRLADAPRRVRPRRWLLRVARLCVARFCGDFAVLRFAILAIAFLSLVSRSQRFFSAHNESTINEPVMVKGNGKLRVKVPVRSRAWKNRTADEFDWIARVRRFSARRSMKVATVAGRIGWRGGAPPRGARSGRQNVGGENAL